MAGPSPWWRSALLSLAAGLALSVLGNVPGMGLPGALALIPAMPLILLVWDVSPEAMFPRDSAWPFAIAVTAFMGPLIPLTWLGTRALGLAGGRRALAVLAAFLLGSTAIALGTYAVGIAPMLAG